MTLLFTSFLAGALTILAPCILPLLPVIVGGSLREGETKNWRRPLVITGSLVASVVIFTLLLRASTVLIDVPEQFWRVVSASIVALFGLFMLLPHAWDKISLKLGLANSSNRLLARASSKKGMLGDIFIGAALGPVFTSCSPTYGIILATVLPVSLAEGTIYLIAYAIGLALMLLAVVFLGNKLIHRLGWATKPGSAFRRVLGALFIAVALMVAMGWDKDIQTWLIERGIYDPIAEVEMELAR